jgi:NAD(P)-dependent dehydrogenase (short-subunit alcohol dehydrogenase family)
MTSRTVLVTGSTDGIGRAAAECFAALGASVIVHGKDPDRVARTLDPLRSRHPGSRTDSITADLRDPQAIGQLADDVRALHDHLDVLVNNAGVFMRERVLTEEGLETTFAVNALAPYRVSRILAPLLGPSGRIVNTASIAHFSTTEIAWDNIHGARHCGGMRPRASSNWVSC